MLSNVSSRSVPKSGVPTHSSSEIRMAPPGVQSSYDYRKITKEEINKAAQSIIKVSNV